MTDETPDATLDQKLRSALGSAGQPDFDAWQAQHAEAVAYLNPVVSEFQRRRRRIIVRTARVMLAAAACACAIWFLIPAKETFAFAQTVKKIDDAKTITWTSTFYTRRTSRDGKRSWLEAARSERAFRRPGLFRATQFDADGKPRWVYIADFRSGETLDFDLKEKKVTKGPVQYQMRIDPLGGNPFDGIANALKASPLELAGQRSVNGKTVNVVRVHGSGETARSHEYWIDAQSKQLVRYADIGSDVFDPQTDPDRGHPAEAEPSMGQAVGTIWSDIVYDAQLDADLFSLTPPVGYEFVKEVPPPARTEDEIIEWLGALARVNKGQFPSGLKARTGYEPTRWSEIAKKKHADRTQAEQEMYDLSVKYANIRDRGVPVERFMKENAVDGSFRYVGVGVKLGSGDRFVCWYKSKTSGKYRAVFGDLTVKDVSPKDLPLPVDR